jgi:hypothetical protein
MAAREVVVAALGTVYALSGLMMMLWHKVYLI